MTDRRALFALVALHLAVVALVQPRGEFPLNDDWAYAQSVQWLLSEGRIRLSGWVGMNLLPQTLAGGLVAAVFGFSFEALRHLTQLVAVLALAAAYFWFREIRLDWGAALAATCAMAAFPAWPVLANSYMTDLYGLALALPAALFFLRALERFAPRDLALATLFSVAGVLERQVVLVLPFAFFMAWAWTSRHLAPRSIAIAVAPFVATALAAAGYHAYLEQGPGVPEGHRLAYGRLLPMALKALTNEDGVTAWAFSNLATIGAYLGWFAAGWFAWWGMAGSRRTLQILLAAATLIAIAAFAFAWFPPYRPQQVIDAAGIGPFLLYDAVRGTAPLDRGGGWFWPGVGVVAALGTAALAVALALAAARLTSRGVSGALVFNLAVIAGYLGPFIVTDYFDRYLLFVLPFAFALWAHVWPAAAPPRWLRVVAAAWIAASILLSAMATRDYFSWNRARWDAIRAMERSGADAESLDGGFEYNAWRRHASGVRSIDGKSWYFVADDRYVVAFSAVPGYEVLGTWTVRRWLPRTPAEVKLLRRKP